MVTSYHLHYSYLDRLCFGFLGCVHGVFDQDWILVIYRLYTRLAAPEKTCILTHAPFHFPRHPYPPPSPRSSIVLSCLVYSPAALIRFTFAMLFASPTLSLIITPRTNLSHKSGSVPYLSPIRLPCFPPLSCVCSPPRNFRLSLPDLFSLSDSLNF